MPPLLSSISADPAEWLQPRSYHAFRCIGAECEDTCCVGWIVNIDKHTYEAYQRSDDPELGPRLHELVTINAGIQRRQLMPASADRTRVRVSSRRPVLHSEKAGRTVPVDDVLGYPRVMNMVDDVLQRSLDLSCPEAARIVLLDPGPMQFDEEEGRPHDPRLGHFSMLRTSNGTPDPSKPYRYFREIRGFVIWLLQYRAYPLWKRLVILGSLCDQLQEMSAVTGSRRLSKPWRPIATRVESDLFGEALKPHYPRPAEQLELILELIVGRISSDFTASAAACLLPEIHAGHGVDRGIQHDRHRPALHGCSLRNTTAPFMSRHRTFWNITW